MRKVTLVLGIAFALSLLIVGVASADNAVHGNYTPTTDACAGCHRAHTGVGDPLLFAPTNNFCFACHGTTATGADTNVQDGVMTERDGITESPAEGVVGNGLRGGGFSNAKMDTSLSGTATSAPATSQHVYSATTAFIWGNGSSGAGTSLASMACVNCHDPHGTNGYRILRPIPTGSGAIVPVPVADVTPKFYTVGQVSYYGESYTNPTGVTLANWCATCHTRYLGASSGNPRAAPFMYIHTSNSGIVNCMSCHVAHGTSARMTTGTTQFSGAVKWPDGSTTPNGDARSSLLRLNNRGVCEQCHQK